VIIPSEPKFFVMFELYCSEGLIDIQLAVFTCRL